MSADHNVHVDRQNRGDIVYAIVGPEHRELYLNSPAFHIQIDTLAAMLPAWVDGLAVHARHTDRRNAALLEIAMNTPMTDDAIEQIRQQTRDDL